MTPIGIPARPADSKKRTWVFNPPPGWPAPPEKWEPEAGWLPDPVWPSPPPGWEFWRPVSRRPRRGPTFYVKAAAGVLTFAATITGTYLAFKGQPTTFTAASWERQANAACDQDAGALNLSIGQWLGTWNHNNVVAGMLGCTYTNNGLRIVWGIDNALIGMTAYGSDSAAMYQWWTNSAYLITS
jgi:hypothetical protein